MKHLKLFFACLLMAVLSIGQVWAGTMSVDFESAASAYTDWTITTITTQQTNSGVSAHGGSYFGSTNAKETGSIVTKNKVNPSSITFYVSKLSTNTNAGSVWKIEVSSDNSTWTQVGDDQPAANGITKGTWTEVTRDLSSYSNVYVRVSYSGTTAARCIDDLVLTTADGGSDPVSVTGVTLDQSEAEITVGGTVTLTPTVAPNDATNKAVTWESDDEDVATVDGGVVTGVAVGTATITVKTVDGNKTATCAVTVTAAPAAATYEKVTAAPSDWSGEYLLVYESGTTAHVWTGADAANCYATATISANAITKPNGAATLTIAAVTGGYSLLISGDNNDGKYITDNANNAALKFADAAYAATISYETDWTKIMFSQRCIRFNNGTSSGMRFRYYAATGQQPVQLYKKAGAPAAVAKPTISGTDNFLTSTEVTIECTTDGAAIYYTTTESAKATPATSGDWMAYNGASKPSFSSTTTVWAAAKLGDDWSEVAEKTFTKATILTTAAELVSFATTTDQQVYVNLANWKVTFVSGDYVYLVDASNEGVVLKQASHGYTAGDVLSDVAYQVTAKKSSGRVQLSGFTSENISATSGTVEPSDVTDYSTITAANQSALVTLKEATYDATNGTFSDGVNEIYYYDQFNANPTLIDGKNYDVTGIVIYYKTNTAEKVEIAPRTSGDVVPNEVIVIPTAANLAALKAAERGTYILTLTNAVVTYVNGNNAFIEDATGGALIYIASHGFTAGNCLNGDYQVTTTDHQGKFEITAIEPQAGAATTTAEIPLTTISIATLNANFGSYESMRVKIAGANVTGAISGSDRNGEINDGAAVAVYAAVASTITLTADDNVDIIGYPGYYNTNQQFNVWQQSDITVNVKDPAGIAFDPASATITAGDAWSAPDFANPNSLDVTFSSDDESVATVSNAGVVALAGGYGTAVITAHTDGDATHNAGNATYTVTVNDPASVDTRKVANSPATFTAVSGDLTPNDITFASYQGGAGTAPQNYNNGIRLYQAPSASAIGGYITLTAKAGCTIDEVQITTTSTYATTITYSVDGNETLLKSESVAKSGSYTTGTGLNVQSVNIVNKGTSSSGRLEIASIKVYYTGEPASIHHYVLGGTYQTAFMQGDEFNHTGLIVYAAYDELEETKVDITSMCTFSEPDMSTTGEKTIEITYNEAVVASYTINVAADSRKVANSPATFTTVSGDMTPNDITFASNQGGASTAPANYNDGIRLYQAPSGDAIGGFITLKAKKGCTIDQVKITTTNTYATTVAYSVDGNENLLGSESVAKSSDYSTPSGLNVESVNIVNKGTGSNGRLEIASIKVWYTGDPLAVDHYILGGTYATEFEQYGEFNYEGLTVTAAYDAGETITEAVTGFTVEADLSTAGAKKAEVMLNSVKIAEYDITVTASAKTDPALAYSPASVILTLGDALSAPMFSNTYNVSPITYSSDKPAVATVDAEGNIALAGGCGVAVITASFAENDDYIASEATFTITVNEPAEDLSGTWVLATSVAVGDKIIIGATYQDATKSMGAQNGNNRLAVASTLDAGVLSPGEGTKVFTLVDAGDGKFAIQALNGNYLSAAGTGTSNYLKEAADYTADNAKWSISIDGEGVASVVALSENRNAMQYNSGSTLFSCYASVTSQRPINIYKKGTPTPVYETVREGLTPNHYYTICYPKAMTDIQGATLWSFVGKDANFAYIEQETATTIEAGKPYIMYATASTVTAVLGTDVASAGVNGAIHGTLDPMVQGDLDDAATDAGSDVYLVIGDELRRATGTGTGSNTLPANRAFVVLGDIPAAPAPANMPAHVRRMPMQKDVATGFENLNASEKPVKLMIDGNIFILRGEKLYDATGRLVK